MIIWRRKKVGEVRKKKAAKSLIRHLVDLVMRHLSPASPAGAYIRFAPSRYAISLSCCPLPLLARLQVLDQ
jgi:hypothetical protein